MSYNNFDILRGVCDKHKITRPLRINEHYTRRVSEMGVKDKGEIFQVLSYELKVTRDWFIDIKYDVRLNCGS